MNNEIFKGASNIIEHENGFISFTHQITWLTGMETGWGNGYVCLPEGNKNYGVDYDDIEVDVNGGLTFSEEVEFEGKKYWCVGFDCAHSWNNSWTHNEAFVIEETKRLFDQLC